MISKFISSYHLLCSDSVFCNCLLYCQRLFLSSIIEFNSYTNCNKHGTCILSMVICAVSSMSPKIFNILTFFFFLHVHSIFNIYILAGVRTCPEILKPGNSSVPTFFYRKYLLTIKQNVASST